ncbi:CysE Serine acetyltransferase [uncultured Caudovirales phage]|uniref:CysE Serine acetyltransferase n=1 Tax=uncultured Caudovirales phage TaxID=2100421 RepID=A0A6J5T1H9_9CAUD|nr:CysE Serine acetyltransferase [uncultured Caudovirales phage]CAB4165852.1 CysE Serine acetyltransferase [uncultured Caudovirales phage]CAB4186918.1 CysE Serine acetyltransferase [uncultured Caudovirales phage]CAB4221400.1 CysE Serine acetyltransferase [uncultured Caudovirales phage]
MLINYDTTNTLFILGKSIYAHELYELISNENTGKVESITTEQFLNLPKNSQCILGIKNMEFRQNFLENTIISQHCWPNYVHPSAVVISKRSVLAPGVIIGPLAIIGYNVILEAFCDVGPASTIGHGSQLGRNTIASNTVRVGGTSKIGANVFLSQMCSINTKITIVDNCTIGMNSVVTKDITVPGTYVGSPVRKTQTYKIT